MPNVFGNKPGIRFVPGGPGFYTDQSLTGTGRFIGTVKSILWVGNLSATPPASADTITSTVVGGGPGSGGGSYAWGHTSAGTGYMEGAGFGSTLFLAGGSATFIGIVNDASSTGFDHTSRIYYDGSGFEAASFNTGGSGPNDNFDTIGAATAGYDYGYNGDLAMVVVMGGRISQANHTKLYQWSRTRFSLP